MRNGFLGALALCLAAASQASAQNGNPGYSFPPVPGHPAPGQAPVASPPTTPYLPPPKETQVPLVPTIHGWPPVPGSVPSGAGVDIDAHRFKLRPASLARPQEKVPFPPAKSGNDSSQAPKNPEGEGPPSTPIIPGMPLIADDFDPAFDDDPPDFYRVPRGYKWYGRGEYLLWWFKDRGAPPLLTIGPPGGAGTVTIGGSGELAFDNQERHGGRFTVGRWLGLDQKLAFEGTYFFFGRRTPGLTAAGPFLSRPFFNTSLGVPATAIIAAPGVATGTARIEALSRMWGAEGNVRWEFLRTGWGHFDWTLGFRTLGLDENLNINHQSTLLAVVAAPGSQIISDRFGTHNNLWAGQVGFEGELNVGRFFIEARQKVALGPNRQVVEIRGNTITAPGGVATFGLLTQPSNIGEYSRSKFTVLLESGVTGGFNLTESFRIFADYTFLFLNNAARPGDQIDSRVQVFPGVGAPAPLHFFRDTQFWAQGLGFGMEFRY